MHCRSFVEALVLREGSSGRVFSAMQAERSLLAKTLCLVALIGAVYVLATGMPNTVARDG